MDETLKTSDNLPKYLDEEQVVLFAKKVGTSPNCFIQNTSQNYSSHSFHNNPDRREAERDVRLPQQFTSINETSHNINNQMPPRSPKEMNCHSQCIKVLGHIQESQHITLHDKDHETQHDKRHVEALSASSLSSCIGHQTEPESVVEKSICYESDRIAGAEVKPMGNYFYFKVKEREIANPLLQVDSTSVIKTDSHVLNLHPFRATNEPLSKCEMDLCHETRTESCDLYTCGGCRKRFGTMCTLHNHLLCHVGGGCYKYNHFLRTAFPTFDTVCASTQTVSELHVDANENSASCRDSVKEISDEEKSPKVSLQDDVLDEDTDNYYENEFKSKEYVSDSDLNELMKDKDIEHEIHSHTNTSTRNQNQIIQGTGDSRDCKAKENTRKKRKRKHKRKFNGGKNNLSKSSIKNEIQIPKDIQNNEKTSLKTNIENLSTIKDYKRYCKTDSHENHIIDDKLDSYNKESGSKNEMSESDYEVNISKSEQNRAKGRVFLCKICNKSYKSKQNLSHHLMKVHNEKTVKRQQIHECKWCGEKLENRMNLLHHVKSCDKKDDFRCYICDISHESKDYLIAHLVTHRNKDDLTCKVCNKEFPSVNVMQSHAKRHKLPRSVQCERCGKAFYIQLHLRKHLVYCSSERTLSCPKCHLKFKNREALKHHSSVHSDDKPFMCHICGYAGKKLMYLKRHIRSHTGERPYACKVCGMKFSALNGLNRHKKVHSNEKTCVCSYCGKAFTNNWNLKTHERQHTGDTPYKCQHCGMSFKQNVLVKLHIKSHHPDIAIPASQTAAASSHTMVLLRPRGVNLGFKKEVSGDHVA